MTAVASPRSVRVGLAIVLAALPLLFVAAAIVVMLVAGPPLDSTVVTHWGVAGPDGWGPAWSYPVLVASIGLGLPVLAWASTLAVPRIGDAVVLVAALVLGVSVLLTFGLTWSFVQQPAAADIGLPLALGAVLGLALGLGAWFLLPREPLRGDPAAPAPELGLAEGQRAAWTGSVSAGTGLIVVVTAVLVLGLAVAATTLAAVGWAAWPSLLVVVLVLLLATTLRWRVAAGPSGLVVRSAAGWPVFRIPAAAIVQARAVRVEAFGEFGGWGLRWAPGHGRRGRFGVIVRSGEALEVTRRDGRVFVVTVADAETAAAVLEAQRRG